LVVPGVANGMPATATIFWRKTSTPAANSLPMTSAPNSPARA
jgi:hypothetical protein